MAEKLIKAITSHGWNGQRRIDFEVEEQQNGTFQIRRAVTRFNGTHRPVTEVVFYLAADRQDLTETLTNLTKEFFEYLPKV